MSSKTGRKNIIATIWMNSEIQICCHKNCWIKCAKVCLSNCLAKIICLHSCSA